MDRQNGRYASSVIGMGNCWQTDGQIDDIRRGGESWGVGGGGWGVDYIKRTKYGLVGDSFEQVCEISEAGRTNAGQTAGACAEG